MSQDHRVPPIRVAPARGLGGVAAYDCITTYQLAQLLCVSRRKLERDRQNGTGIPYVKYGRRVLYRPADVASYLEAQRFASTAEARRAAEVR